MFSNKLCICFIIPETTGVTNVSNTVPCSKEYCNKYYLVLKPYKFITLAHAIKMK